VRFALGVILAAAVASAMGPSVAAAAPTIKVTATCAYSGGQLAVAGKGFAPGEAADVELMSTADPLSGAPTSSRAAVADAGGIFVAILDAPPTAATTPVALAVRARATAAAGSQAPLATTTLRSVRRAVVVSDAARLSPSASQRWHLVGLPEGTPLYAHFRHDGHTVSSVQVGEAADPCGRLAFDLRVLPRTARRGTWDLWLTADRTFRRPTKGIYVRRRLTVRDGRARAGAIASRLTPLDPRFTAPVTNGAAADISRIGLVELTFVDAQGAPVEFLERIGDRLVRLGTARAAPDEILTVLSDATTWSCDRPERRFVATSTRPDGALAVGTYSVRTPSCVSRFELAAPRRTRPGEVVRIRVSDRWGIGGVTPTLCVTPPEAKRSCRPLALGRGVTVASRRFRAAARGDWLVQLRVRDRSVRKAVVAVGSGSSAAVVPTILATGDSTMQGIDGFLGDELGDAASVVSDVRIGTGISKSEQPSLPDPANPEALQWGLLATEQTQRLLEAATVVSLGANEGFPMRLPGGATAECCTAPWKAEYVRRARLMMQTYARDGQARVLWLTLPLPRDDRRLGPTTAVNGAILDAAAGVAGVKVLRMDLVFTPDGYRDVIRYRGRAVDVRDTDGVHLNVAGTAIAAQIVAQALRRRV
jgi:hypothetical protein